MHSNLEIWRLASINYYYLCTLLNIDELYATYNNSGKLKFRQTDWTDIMLGAKLTSVFHPKISYSSSKYISLH